MILIHSLNFISLNSIISHQIHLIVFWKSWKSSKYPSLKKSKKSIQGGYLAVKWLIARFACVQRIKFSRVFVSFSFFWRNFMIAHNLHISMCQIQTQKSHTPNSKSQTLNPTKCLKFLTQSGWSGFQTPYRISFTAGYTLPLDTPPEFLKKYKLTLLKCSNYFSKICSKLQW